MEGRACQGELRSGDAHGIEGVDVEDVEPAASVHQHLGEALLANDGIDMGRMVPLIEGDRRF